MANPYPDAAKWTIRNDDFVYMAGIQCGSAFTNPEVLSMRCYSHNNVLQSMKRNHNPGVLKLTHFETKVYQNAVMLSTSEWFHFVQ